MDLTVIICTHNRAHSLARTLEAIALQVVPSAILWEIIIVDNNSSDATAFVVEAHRSKISAPLTYLFEKRQGKSVALNTAIKAARGAVLAFTDDDVTPQADWLTRIMEAIARHGADGVGGRILPLWSSAPPPWLSAEKKLLPVLAVLDSTRWEKLGAGNLARIFGANMAFRRELFAELGEFDTTLGPMGSKAYRHEEVDFVSRAVAAGRAIVYDPSIVVWHNIGPERMRRSYFRKVSFDDGENAGFRFDGGNGRKIFGIPPFGLRFVARSFFKWIRLCLTERSRGFRAELEVWRRVGFCWGCLKRGMETEGVPQRRPRKVGLH